MYVCVCVFWGVPAFLAFVCLPSCTWKMKAWGPMLRMKREQCPFLLLKCKYFWRVKPSPHSPGDQTLAMVRDWSSQLFLRLPRRTRVFASNQAGCSSQGRYLGHKRSWQIFFLRRYSLVCLGEGKGSGEEVGNRDNTDCCVAGEAQALQKAQARKTSDFCKDTQCCKLQVSEDGFAWGLGPGQWTKG